ncbi:MAG: hypothetical protein KatS3mg115_2507 [Candidatus Poribacteria bacterium]|nr:MAG: hypothetical protein KatS3mg115_2507 [Candidatus Poribacteria bacterium]
MRSFLGRGRLLLLAGLIGTVGCAGYSTLDLQRALAEGRVQAAYRQLSARAENTLPHLFEAGLVAFYAQEYAASIQAFERAKVLAEAAYTLSLSREAAALLTSDAVRTYVPSRYERLMVHFYEALDYLALGLRDDVLVEARQAGFLLRQYADADPTFQFAGAAFVAYFTGLLYEWAGEWNDAYIAYRWAEEAYNRAREHGGPQPPPELGASLVRLAQRLGFTDDAARYRARYGSPEPIPDGWGELVFIHESGFAPHKEEENLLLPILKSDRIEEEREVWVWAGKIVERRQVRYSNAELEYLLRVAIPVLQSNPPRLGGARLTVAGREARTRLVEDLDWAMRLTFAQESGTILLRTTARALLKYLTYKRIQKASALAGMVYNLFTVIAEQADLRSWQTLPNRVYIARIPLPAGAHEVSVLVPDRHGAPRPSDGPLQRGDSRRRDRLPNASDV